MPCMKVVHTGLSIVLCCRPFRPLRSACNLIEVAGHTHPLRSTPPLPHQPFLFDARYFEPDMISHWGGEQSRFRTRIKHVSVQCYLGSVICARGTIQVPLPLFLSEGTFASVPHGCSLTSSAWKMSLARRVVVRCGLKLVELTVSKLTELEIETQQLHDRWSLGYTL